MPKQVSKKLREMLGEDAGVSMAEWLESQERHFEEVRQELRADMAELRHEMQIGFARVDAGFARVDARFAETDAEIAALGERTAQQLASGFKWAIGVWISSLAAVVGLMGLMRVLR